MSKNNVITIQYKLIEMSQTRARGACTQMNLKNTHPNGNKIAFDCTRFEVGGDGGKSLFFDRGANLCF